MSIWLLPKPGTLPSLCILTVSFVTRAKLWPWFESGQENLAQTSRLGLGGGWGCEVSCGGNHRPRGKTTTGSALDGAVCVSESIQHHTETKMSSFWRNFHHWLHWKLSFWQLPVQPVMNISSKWRLFRFSVSSDSGLWPIRRQAITWTNAYLLSIGPLGTNFSEILNKIFTFSLKKMHLKLLSAKMAAILSRGR